MSNLVTVNNNGIAVTTSLKIAEGVGNTHKTVIQLVRKNIKDFEEFGRIAFEM
ncbi:Rha family transcriptional regulator, partial [Bartonella florencae]|uniref:Rha family transcriptional regulator n=1 Tax=Bartonella florencae TaxID=928210 RepID=UPI0005519395